MRPFKVLFGLVLFFFTISTSALPGSEPKLLAIKFHADWCKSCKKMGSSYDELKMQFKGKPVEFILLDFTNKKTQDEARKIIAKHMIESVVSKHVGTGFILVIDRAEMKAKTTMGHKKSVEEMEKILHGFLR